MTHSAYICPDVRLAWRDKDIVVLNIGDDAYSCLVDAASVLSVGPIPGAVQTEDAELLTMLLKAGLLTETPTASTLPIPRLTRTLDIPPSRNLALSGAAVVNAIQSTITFRRLGFAGLIATVQRRNSQARRSDLQAAAMACGAFQAVLPWIPWGGECLQRAFMLHHHLHSSGVRADWVFGVRTWPFLAHCWLQIDDVVVGDTADRVGGFTPILIV